MKRVTHILFVVALTTSIGFRAMPADTLYVATAILASTLPDLDLKKRHRKLLHNVFAPLILSVVLIAVLRGLGLNAYYLVKGFIIGWFSHVALDLITKKGVALFYPLSSRYYGLRICESNSIACNFLISTISIMIILYNAIGLITTWTS